MIDHPPNAEAERAVIRDVPASCDLCLWTWNPRAHRWQLIERSQWCAWHGLKGA